MNISKEGLEKLKAALKDNNDNIVSDSLYSAYDIQREIDHMQVIARRRRQGDAEEVLRQLELSHAFKQQEAKEPYVPLMARNNRSGPYFQMQDVLLACGELNKRERVAIEWLLGKANELHKAYEEERMGLLGYEQ